MRDWVVCMIKEKLGDLIGFVIEIIAVVLAEIFESINNPMKNLLFYLEAAERKFVKAWLPQDGFNKLKMKVYFQLKY